MVPFDGVPARAAALRPISQIGERLGLIGDDLEPYGKYKAKIAGHVRERLQGEPDGRLVLVTSINPTPAGEGKTTVSIGLAQALDRLGHRAIVCLRQPSLGPVFGVKGGATGGGLSQVVPMEEINLHFTGDFHAITAAHNLLAAVVDNHLHQGNRLGIDPRAIAFRRVLDMNDRALRAIVVGLGGRNGGVPRQDGFQITPASEVMAILCLAGDLADLRERLGRILVGLTYDGQPVTAADLKVHGAMAALLKDAIKPNLVQTLEGTPALVHGGPFANIAHGTSSVIATRLGLKLADYVVTEAGFGADLGAEKYVDIVCRAAGFQPAVAVIVATVRALKLHGGQRLDELEREDLAALSRGMENLEKHLENVTRLWGLPAVVAINCFPTDTEPELALLEDRVRATGARVARAEVWARGGAGGEELARQVVSAAAGAVQVPLTVATVPGAGVPVAAGAGGLEPVAGNGGMRFTYEMSDSLEGKIEKIVTRVYGGAGVTYTREAERSLRKLKRLGMDRYPVCVAKTQYSLADDPLLLGRPSGFTVTVRELLPSAGAGFVVAITGEIMTMPGLPRDPAAERIDIGPDGQITGLG